MIDNFDAWENVPSLENCSFSPDNRAKTHSQQVPLGKFNKATDQWITSNMPISYGI